MNYNDLLQANTNDDMKRRIEHLKNYTDKELAASASNPVNDYRNVQAAKNLLIQRGVKGVPL